MKKLITLLLLCTTMAFYAQEAYWTHYTFTVEPKDEATVFKLIDDYFKEHKNEGVSVGLYANHFHDADFTYTHMITFSGSLDALGAMYAADGGDAWDLLVTRLNSHIEEGSGARMGTTKKVYGDAEGDYPVQRLYVLDVEDNEAFEKEYEKFQNDHKPEGRVVMMGNITSGVSVHGENHWVIVGFKDFKAAMGGATAGMSSDQKKARDASWKTFRENNGGVRLVRSSLRVRLGQW